MSFRYPTYDMMDYINVRPKVVCTPWS